MSDEKKIKEFVQETLGCGCPEEVFCYIEHNKDVDMPGNVCLSDRINIGNRLLVYILETNDLIFIEKELDGLIKEGIKERDDLGFNRFRMVISADNVSEMEDLAFRVFDSMQGKDDRVHLHVIKNKEISAL
ncbi:hypothetical protein CUJ83_11915 [Methanocella sp. CWC-04]|uniref:Uncharacterized protein n=1 Tax=Methanooceanicella nereidis TaxID=2052831 RepID=A0AAP2RE60_9EURY|nr:hypothetical protein [Methanocella sp. CWC-04]MCD1295704.1 hypothetical protein [Methanocella sp. CWC-04]